MGTKILDFIDGLGDLHAQGRHGVEFYTQTKVVVERWPKEWSRQF